MSRLGRIPIKLPQGVEVRVEVGTLSVVGPLGRMEQEIPPEVTLEMSDGSLLVNRASDNRRARMMQGLMRSLAANMVTGVSRGFERVLEIVGVGYRAELKGDKLVVSLGYAKPVEYGVPEGIKIEVERTNRIKVKGIDRQRVGQTAAQIRGLRKPEPYKGKGIKYVEERIRRKVGKAGVK